MAVQKNVAEHPPPPLLTVFKDSETARIGRVSGSEFLRQRAPFSVIL